MSGECWCHVGVSDVIIGILITRLDRFSDSEAWTEVQGALIDSCLAGALLYIVQAPEVQWRCLNLIHLFLVEEAESGRYQARIEARR
ncbi:unnamed protein product [Symbiodinium necroappetens]|uniref:Uncharacterized protein n=1 Tax=Symbiodinium necroappetens TaxID=1628268 RepID=A0A813AK05_9DINO|nr:unnamed protein product [Symbiodinium necroappetens]